MEGPRQARHADTVELCVLLRGEMVVDLDGRRFRLAAGDGSLIPPGVVHSSWTEQQAIEEIVVHLDAAAVETRLGPVRAGTRRLLPRELAILVRAAAGDDVAEALLPLVEGFGLTGGPGVGDERLRRVLDAVGVALTEPWTVGRLASIAAMSPAHFSRSFHEALGAPPLRWVQDRRLDRAEWLVSTTDLTLTEIAQVVGFRSSSRLTEAFQRRHGVSPSRWRADRQSAPVIG